MLDRIHIQNYKCLLDTEVALGAFNVLIGPNDSGKTSFLEAVQLLGAIQFGDMSSQVWKKEAGRKIIIAGSGQTSRTFLDRLEISPPTGNVIERVEIDQEEMFDTTKLGRPGDNSLVAVMPTIRWVPNQRPLTQIVAASQQAGATRDQYREVLDALQSSAMFQLDPVATRMPVPAATNPSLDAKGRNLAAVLQAMLSGPDRQAILDLESKLHEAIPTLKGVSTPLNSANAYQIEFTLNIDTKPPVTIPCSQASDGAMLLTGFLVLAYGNTPRRLLVEEPENGLHPSRLKMVIDILRKISTGEIGNQPRQVIITTHSPLLLNFVQPEEVRIFRRDETQGTKVISMDQAPNISRLRQEFAPGELWYLFGEEDLVKGQAS